MTRVALAIAGLVLASACGGTPASPEEARVAQVAEAIVHGTESDASEDAVVLLVRYDPSLPNGMAADCSGTMLSPRIVLTARHCVAVTDDSAACNDQGTADFGGKVLGDFKARSVFAFGGTKRPDILAGADASRGLELVTNGASTYCDNDIALVVLEKPLPNAQIRPVRLEGKASAGEKVTLVGWGITETTPEPPVRQKRSGVAIELVGPALHLGPKELQIGEGSCSGDSGGPLLSEKTGAVVGVLSRGGNGTDTAPPDSCLGGSNVYTSTGAHAALVRAAFEKTGETPWLEGEPDPKTVPAAPPAAAPEEDGGCALAPRAAHGSELLGVAVIVGALLAARRRRG